MFLSAKKLSFEISSFYKGIIKRLQPQGWVCRQEHGHHLAGHNVRMGFEVEAQNPLGEWAEPPRVVQDHPASPLT